MDDVASDNLNCREQIAHIDRMLADAARGRPQTKLALWAPALLGMTTGAALFAVGGVFMKVFG